MPPAYVIFFLGHFQKRLTQKKKMAVVSAVVSSTGYRKKKMVKRITIKSTKSTKSDQSVTECEYDKME
jgi:hypothetical protein